MPSNIVKTKAQEQHWTHAKERVREQYPDLDENDDRFYALTTSIFKKMAGLRKNLMHDIHPDLQRAMVERTCEKCQDMPVGAKVDYLRKTVQRYRECEQQQHALEKAQRPPGRRLALVLCL